MISARRKPHKSGPRHRIQTLGLKILFHAFEVDVAETPRDQTAKEVSTILGELRILTQCKEKWFGDSPEDDDGDVEQSQNDESSLQ